MKTFSLKTLTLASFAAAGMTCCTIADKISAAYSAAYSDKIRGR